MFIDGNPQNLHIFAQFISGDQNNPVWCVDTLDAGAIQPIAHERQSWISIVNIHPDKKESYSEQQKQKYDHILRIVKVHTDQWHDVGGNKSQIFVVFIFDLDNLAGRIWHVKPQQWVL